MPFDPSAPFAVVEEQSAPQFDPQAAFEIVPDEEEPQKPKLKGNENATSEPRTTVREAFNEQSKQFNEAAFKPFSWAKRAIDAAIPSFIPETPEMQQLVGMSGLGQAQASAAGVAERVKGAAGSIASPGGVMLAGVGRSAPGVTGGTMAGMVAPQAIEGVKELGRGEIALGITDLALAAPVVFGGSLAFAKEALNSAKGLSGIKPEARVAESGRGSDLEVVPPGTHEQLLSKSSNTFEQTTGEKASGGTTDASKIGEALSSEEGGSGVRNLIGTEVDVPYQLTPNSPVHTNRVKVNNITESKSRTGKRILNFEFSDGTTIGVQVEHGNEMMSVEDAFDMAIKRRNGSRVTQAGLPVEEGGAGVREKKAAMTEKASPEELESSGASREEIFSKTGMWKSPGGKWVSDNAAIEIPEAFSEKYFQDVLDRNPGPVKGYTLEELIGSDHKLFEQHPDLKGMRVFVDLQVHRGSGSFGYSVDGNGWIHINIPTKAIYDKASKSSKWVREHVIVDESKSLAEGKYKIVQESPSHLISQVLNHEVNHAIQKKLGLEEGGSPLDYFFDNNVKWNEAEANTVAYDYYMRLAGEAMSRMSEVRSKMTDAERLAEPPWVTLEKMLQKEGILKPGQSAEDVLTVKIGGKVVPRTKNPAAVPAEQAAQKFDPSQPFDSTGEVSSQIPPGPGAKTNVSNVTSGTGAESLDYTGMKNAIEDLERAGLGFPEREPTVVQPMAEAWVRAGETLQNNPEAGRNLTQAMVNDPRRGFTGDESAVMLRHKVNVQNALNDAAERTWTAKTPEEKLQAELDYARYSDELQQILEAGAARRTRWGREGRWMQAIARDDFSFAAQEARARAAKGGEALTDGEVIKLKEQLAEREKYVKELEEQIRKSQEANVKANNQAQLPEDAKQRRQERKSSGAKEPAPVEKSQDTASKLKESIEEGLEDGELESYIKEIVNDVVERGATDYDAIFNEAHQIIQDAGIQLTRGDIEKAYSDYGKSTPAPTDPIKVRKAQLRAEAQKVQGLQTVLNENTPPLATGQRRVPASDLYRRTVKQIHEMMKKLGITIGDPAKQLADALQARKTYRINRMKDLRHELATGKRIVKDKALPISDAELEALDAEYQQLKREHADAFPPEPLTDEQRINIENKSLDREIAKLQDDIANNRLGPEPTRPRLSTPELEAKRQTLKDLRSQREELRALDEHFQEVRERKSLEAQKERLLDDMAEKRRRLAEGDVDAKGNRISRPAHPELEALLQERDKLNRDIAEARKPSADEKAATELQRKLKGIEKRIDEVEAKIAAGDVGTRSPKASRPLTPELEKAQQRLEALNKRLGELRHPKLTAEELALKAAERRLNSRMKRLTQLEEKLAKRDYTRKAKRPEPKLDTKALAVEAKIKEVEQKIAEDRIRWEKERMTWFEQKQEMLLSWARNVKLASWHVFPKLIIAGITRVGTNPIYRIAGQPLRLIPGLVEKAPVELRMSLKAEAQNIAGILSSGPEVFKKLFKGRSELDVLGGKLGRDREMLSFIGNSHGAIKEPVRRGQFKRAVQIRTEEAIRQGLDPEEPAVATNIVSSAIADANREIFMGQNMVTKYLIRLPLAALRASNKTGAKTLANAVEFLIPIVNVPTNITIATARLNPLIGFSEAFTRLALAAKRGELANRAEKLSVADAESISRAFKYGMVGTLLAAYAWQNEDQFGGLYGEPPDKTRTLKPGETTIFGVTTPSWMGHAPELQFLNTVAAARRVYDRYYAKGEGDAPNAAAELLAFSLMAPVKNLPFVDNFLRLFDAYHSPGQVLGALFRSATLPTKSYLDLMDEMDGIERRPKTFWQEIQMGIPGQRDEVPIKEEK